MVGFDFVLADLHIILAVRKRVLQTDINARLLMIISEQ